MQVIIANVKLRYLNISHCQINAASHIAVFKALQNKMCLSYFDSFIVKMAAIELDKVFHSNKIITHLLLSHCVFELQSFSKIVPPLKLFGCLRHLDLSNTVNGQRLADDISDIIELCVGEIKGKKYTLNFIKHTLSRPTVLHQPQRVLYCTTKNALLVQ